MIYLDAVGYGFLVKEIREEIKGLKIRKIQSYDNNSFSLIFNKKNLYFENKKEPVIYLKEKKLQNTEREINFILQIKKYILGGIIEDVYLYNEDRIVVLEIEKLNLLNEVKRYKLIYEFLGKSVNAILLEDEIILSSMYTSIGERVILKGAKYEHLDKNSKYGKLMTNIDEKLRLEFETTYKPLIYEDNLVTYNDFYPDKNKTYYESLNKALEIYFENNNAISSLETKKKPILKHIRKNIKRLTKILDKIPNDIEENKDYEKYKIMGDILASNLYQIKSNVDSVKLFNYYDNSEIVINLDKKLSPSKNMEKYYNTYAKKKRKEEVLTKRLDEVKEELAYYEEQEHYTIKEESIIGLEQIEKELGLSNKNIKSTRNSKRELEKVMYMDYEIYYGRNSFENEKITFKIANKNDIWLHAKDVAGSHVIIKGINPSMEVIEYAAKIAAENSKLKGTGEVDYCQRKNVSKIPGSKRALVKYEDYKTINVK